MLPRHYRTESEIRNKQINTLKIFNDNVIEIKQGTEYCIAFEAGKNELTLQIILSADFPNEKPTLKVSPNILHPWVNADGEVISAPGLLNFTVHSDLGRVVQAVIREFERNPPQLTATTSSPIQFSSAMNPVHITSPNYTYANTYSFSPPTTSILKQSIIFPELNTLSLNDLQVLNENCDKQDEYLASFPPIRELNKTLDDLFIQIEELADTNLSQQNIIKQFHDKRKIGLEVVEELLISNDELTEHYGLLSSRYTPANIREFLQVCATAKEAESEMMAERFLNGDLDVDQFLTSYLKIRTLCHTRKAKEEKLAHQISELERAGF